MSFEFRSLVNSKFKTQTFILMRIYQENMGTLKLIFAIFVIVTAGISTACTSSEPAPTPQAPPVAKKEPPKNTTDTPPPTSTDPLAKGKAIFNGSGNCANCHGLEGKPNVTLPHIPNFTDPAWHKKEKDEELAATIKKGKNMMPKYEGPESDIPLLVAYIRSLNKSGAKPNETTKPESTTPEKKSSQNKHPDPM